MLQKCHCTSSQNVQVHLHLGHTPNNGLKSKVGFPFHKQNRFTKYHLYSIFPHLIQLNERNRWTNNLFLKMEAEKRCCLPKEKSLKRWDWLGGRDTFCLFCFLLCCCYCLFYGFLFVLWIVLSFDLFISKFLFPGL